MSETVALLANVGEFVGSIAVLVTLVYLAVQIRQTGRTITANTQQSISDTSSHLFAATATSDVLGEAFAKANRNESLTDVERIRVSSWWHSVLRHAENMHYQWEQGLLPDDLLKSAMRRIMRGLSANTYAQHVWTSAKPDYRESFVIWVDEHG